MLIRRETPADADAIRSVTLAAFQPGYPDGDTAPEAALVDDLRADPAWLPALSLVAPDAHDQLVGHVVCSRARIGAHPALGLGPLSVHPARQHQGVGLALVHAVLGAADALDEPLVVLLGDPRYYQRFGFRLAAELGITPPAAEWAPHFQVRALHAYRPDLRGSFVYATPFDRVS
jgi:putative acetyltransferase